MNFQPGDVVQLKSGGPLMTVNDVEAGAMVTCIWFDKTDQKWGTFPAATLNKVQP